VGDAPGALVQKIIESKPYPEQGYRACRGLMRLGKQYSPERLKVAALRVLRSGAHSYRSVRSILEHSLDGFCSTSKSSLCLPDHHENLRGGDYYLDA
jgi:hypothetical protein